MTVRELTVDDDMLAVSRIYEKSWKWAYRGMVPEEYLNGIPEGRWAGKVLGGGVRSLVAEEGGELVGTASFGASRFPEFLGYGEIISIYLLPDFAGRGIGRALLERAIEELRGMGFERVFLWVIEENRRARGFYERMGFKAAGRYTETEIWGKVIRETAYVLSSEEPWVKPAGKEDAP